MKFSHPNHPYGKAWDDRYLSTNHPNHHHLDMLLSSLEILF
jgi:hypothetical protein